MGSFKNWNKNNIKLIIAFAHFVFRSETHELLSNFSEINRYKFFIRSFITNIVMINLTTFPITYK